MKAFSVHWRSARQFREFTLFADEAVGASILAALEAAAGDRVWQAGTLWKCPGCGDCTVRTEEFLEGLRRAEAYLQRAEALAAQDPAACIPEAKAALCWLADVAAKMFGCDRDRVYIKEEGAACTFAGQTYLSRI